MITQPQPTLISVHGYAGDFHQIKILMELYEHHQSPIVVLSPEDSPVRKFGPHICRFSGKRGYIGPDTWIRQHLQMKVLLEYVDFQWFLMHDSDSVCLEPKLPEYLYENENVLYSNLVDDFRIPGTRTHGVDWPEDYHKGYPLKAAQPPYFCSRKVLEKLVSVDPICNDGITPFIDFALVKWATDSGVELKPFHACASCETETSNGRAVMAECISKRGATFVHAIKTKKAKDMVMRLHRMRKKK